MTDQERREGARQFYNKWRGRGREDEDDRSYWIDLMQKILGVESPTDYIEFQKKVVVDGNTKRIDAYLPETKVIIEQKTLGIALDKKGHQSGGIELTPYEQAKRYNDNLPYEEKARWIVTSNFGEIWIYDMNARVPEPLKINIDELQSKIALLDFLVNPEKKKVTSEIEISIKAGDIVGELYDELYKKYKEPESERTLKSLNVLCVRLVFCLYAEDAGVFGKKDMFYDYLADVEPQKIRRALMELFKVLDTRPEDRDPYLAEENPKLAAFPYVNGGLFQNEDIEIPVFDEQMKKALLENASEGFDWSEISPTIFGAIFESTLNQETRRAGGMHYTSIENIHKVIDPLFYDGLCAEFDEIMQKTTGGGARTKALKRFHDKLASLKFLDPACGSGNFLTESYTSLRKLENKVLRELKEDIGSEQLTFDFINDTDMFNIKVSIKQFYGIEINDFAVTVAKTALWIAEAQMMRETLSFADVPNTFLPLKTNACIIEGNALALDWESVVPKDELNYIMGNPPFVGARLMSKEQKDDIIAVFGKDWKNIGNLDYVSGWYKKAADMMTGNDIRGALVSTNSVVQGEAVGNLWKPLMEAGVHIDFAHRTFRWDSEAKIKAHVHCVIVGFSKAHNFADRYIFNADGEPQKVKNINAYLIETEENIFVESRSKAICDVPGIGIGNKPIDGGNYLFTEEEMEEFIKKEPASKKYFKPWYGSQEFINRKPRYCLWLGDCTPGELRRMPKCLERVARVKEFRLASSSAGTVKLADKPTRFHVENMPDGTYVVIPKVSSERRRYVPMGFMNPDVLCSDLVFIVPDATLYHFGVLTSNVHMSWMRVVCGRLEMRYRYSKDIVYNNFPWPNPMDEQRKKIEQTAQAILDARALYPDSSLADLYDPVTMPFELNKAHTANDIAVMQAYGFDIKSTSEADCVAALMELYSRMHEVSFANR